MLSIASLLMWLQKVHAPNLGVAPFSRNPSSSTVKEMLLGPHKSEFRYSSKNIQHSFQFQQWWKTRLLSKHPVSSLRLFFSMRLCPPAPSHEAAGQARPLLLQAVIINQCLPQWPMLLREFSRSWYCALWESGHIATARRTREDINEKLTTILIISALKTRKELSLATKLKQKRRLQLEIQNWQILCEVLHWNDYAFLFLL